MKWIALLPTFLLLGGCVAHRNSDVIEYQQVVVVAPHFPGAAFFNTDDEGIDVSTTTVSYY